MKLEIRKGIAQGCISAPPSKSMAHRMLICAALAEGECTVRGISRCDDVAATIECLRAIGVEITEMGDDVHVKGISAHSIKAIAPLPCNESGSTLRFMIPIVMLSDNITVFNGAPSLMARPMGVYKKLFSERGLTFANDESTIVVKGRLCGGEFSLPGNVSSQFISGLLFALPLAEKDSIIKITPPLESKSYIELTISALKEFGVAAEWLDEYTINIPGNQRYIPTNATVEGDYSGAAFPDALNLFGADVKISGLRENSIQGDRVYKKYFEMLNMGVPSIHIGDCPDLGPVLFAVAAAKYGGIFTGTRRLKIKESDRAAAMANELKKFGTSVTVYDDTVVIYPTEMHAPTEELNAYNDHRIVMALSVLLTITGGIINDTEVVNKSYPEFFDDLSSLGIEVISLDA